MAESDCRSIRRLFAYVTDLESAPSIVTRGLASRVHGFNESRVESGSRLFTVAGRRSALDEKTP